MFISVVLSGAGIGSLFPYLLNLASEKMPETQSIKAMSITMAFAWFGQFLSPLLFGSVSFLTDLNTANLFLCTSIVFLILAAGLTVVNLQKKQQSLIRTEK
jgi:MFS family permease